MFLLRQLSLKQFGVYVLGQLIGAFGASLFVFLTYLYSLQNYPGGMYCLDTAGIFATYPYDVGGGEKESDTFSLFFDQFFSTSLFMITILAITDKQNTDISHEGVSVLIGFSLTVIGSSFGHNCGFAVNPARDFAPRLFTAIAGWGSLPFTAGYHFFWIPIIAPMLGSVAGTIAYSVFVSNHWPNNYE
jgi:glycerol uptake facilitator-like aquaporin